jgi:hypothetical protein
VRCFIEEVPPDTLVVVQYKVPQASEKLGVALTAKEGQGKVIQTRKDAGLEGKMAFTSETGGEHMFCFATNTTWPAGQKQLRVDVQIFSGSEGKDYKDLAKKENLDELDVAVLQLNDRVKGLLKQHDYIRETEANFRDVSESVNGSAQWWSIGQIVILIISGVWQIRHLQNYFKAKKLV